MSRLKSIVLYSIAFFLLLIFFAPKVYFYYAVENQLNSKNIRISQEKVTDRGFKLAVEDGTVYYDDLVIGHFENLGVVPLVLFNQLKVENFVFSEDMSRFAKGGIDNVNITHHVITPFTLHLNAEADAGSVMAEVNMKDRNISLHLSPSQSLLKESPFWLKKMKKSKEGEYLYETTY